MILNNPELAKNGKALKWSIVTKSKDENAVDKLALLQQSHLRH